jgi:CDP-diglyceride synthetase
VAIHLQAIAKCLFLIGAANGAPILAKHLLGDRFNGPIDGGLVLQDGQPLLGQSKTWRGLISAILVTAAAAPLVGLPAQAGVLVAAAAMAGDSFSSFVKRRLGLERSRMSLGLDQIPESLLPAIASGAYLNHGLLDIAAIVLAFFVGEIILSRILFAIGLRDRPY